VDHDERLQLDRVGSTASPSDVGQVQLQLERAQPATCWSGDKLQLERLQLERE